MDLTGARWRKSSRSGGNKGNGCVEVAFLSARRVAVRDSTDRSLPPQLFPAAGWAAFVAAVLAGEFARDSAR